MGTLLIYALVAIAGFFLVREFRFAMTGIRTERWRMTDGTLAGDDTQVSAGSIPAAAAVRYQYTAEGGDYTSSQIGYGFPTAFPKSVSDRFLRPVLSQAPAVKVYYDPRKPEVSVLITGFQPYNALRMAPLVVLLLAGLLMLIG